MSFAVISATAVARDLGVEVAERRPGGGAFAAARFLLGFTLLAAPLAFGAVEDWAWTALTLLAVLTLWLWAAGSVERGILRIAACSLYWPAATFLLFGAAQFVGRLSPDSSALREALLKLTTDLIFFFLAGQLLGAASAKTWRRLGLAVVVSAFALSLLAIVQFFSSHGLIYWVVKPRWGGTVFGPYVNHNHYAGLMEMMIPVAAGSAVSLSKSNRPARPLLAFAVAVPTASLLLSGSRGGAIGLVAEVLILAAVLRPAVPARRLVLPVALGAALVTSMFFWMDPGDASRRLGTLAGVVNSPELTWGARRTVGRDSMRLFRAHPWVGTGLGSFETVYPAYQSFPSDLVFDHVHNDFAEALAETGLVGAGLIVWALVVFFRLALRDLRECLRRRREWIRVGAFLGCCGLLVHSLFDFNLHIPANAVWFAVCAAVALFPAPGSAEAFRE